MALSISATIVARNEEKKISKCLSSLMGVVDDIVFVHDGPCDDKTLDIAKRYTKKIFVRDFIGEAEPHRKFALENARHNWILQIDADEYLTKTMKKQLPNLIKNQEVSGYTFKWNIAYPGDKKFYDYKLALYQKDKISQFLGIPHETVVLKGKIVRLKNVELGHNREQMSAKELQHKLSVWPRVQGFYTAKYKYHWMPTIVLLAGYLVYPIYHVILDILLRKSRSVNMVCHDTVYAIRFWHAFCYYRLKERSKKEKKIMRGYLGVAKSGWLVNVLVLFLSMILVVVVSEFFIYYFVPVSFHYWRFDDVMHHTFIPNMQLTMKRVPYVNYSVEIVTDSKGFRNVEVPFSKRENMKRVLVVGDSMTASVGVPADKMYTAVLSENLNKNAQRRWEVINGGIEDWSTENEYLYFINEGYKYEPDIVILQFSFNDFNGVLTDSILLKNNVLVFENFPKRSLMKRFLLYLNGKSGVYRLAAMTYKNIFAENADKFPFLSNGAFDRFSESFNETTALIRELNKEVKKQGGYFVVVIFPDHRIVNKAHYDFWNAQYKNFIPQKDASKPIELLKKYFDQQKIQYTDLSEEVNDFEDFISFNDGHLTIQGSKKTGSLIYNKLIAEGLVQ